jgi:mycothiol synthase
MPADPARRAPIVVWRPATFEDAPVLTELQAECRRAEDAPDEILSVDEVRHAMDDPAFILASDTMTGWDARGRLLATTTVWTRPEPRCLARAVLLGDGHPDMRRRGIGAALLAWGVERAHKRLRSPALSGLPGRIDMLGVEGDMGRGALAASEGFTAMRWFTKMARSTATPVQVQRAPVGVNVGPWQPERSLNVLEARNDAWQDHWGYEPMSRAHWEHLVPADPAFLPGVSRVAVAGSRVVGLVLASEQATDEAGLGRTAWLDQIAVRRSWRRQGLASALITSSLVALRDAGFATVALNVDTDSPTRALGLYERYGFRPIRTEVLYARELPRIGPPG